jgi:hypothetical protein
MKKGLIIKKEWLEKIFDSGKCWEMRSTKTKIRGKIYLIESGSGTIVGECELVDSHKLDEDEAKKTFNKHCVENIDLLNKWCHAWHFENIIKYKTPLKYNHPKGAVIWVNL